MTAFMLQNAGRNSLQAYAKLARASQLTARASMAAALSAKQMRHSRRSVRQILALQRRFDGGPLRPRPGISVHNAGELFQDGVFEWPALTASMMKPYFVNKGTQENPNWVPGSSRGPAPYTPAKPLRRLLLALAKHGIEPEIHCDGDRAVNHVLDAHAYVRKHLHGRDVRLEVAHAELVLPSDYKRFRELGVIADMGFQWAKRDDFTVPSEGSLGPERFNRLEPAGYLWRDGATVAQGRDWPVDTINEFFDMKVAVTRKNDLGGKYASRLGTVPTVPVKAAIRMFTINSAYALHEERQTGSLERGKFADLIVLNQNLLRIPKHKIEDTKVLTTMVGGKVVYDRR